MPTWPISSAVMVGVVLLVLAITGYVGLGSILSGVALVPAAMLFAPGPDRPVWTVAAVVIAAFILFTHRGISGPAALDLSVALGKDGAPKFNQQTIGGSLTYAQKYAYKSIVGIPDGEEMIDSTDEKGDLPARAKTQAKPKQTAAPAAAEPAPVAQAPTGVRSSFFSKAKEMGWGLGDIKKLINREYPDAKGSTAALAEDDLNHLLSIMGANKPAEALTEEAAK